MKTATIKPRAHRCPCGAPAFATLELCAKCIANQAVAAFFDGLNGTRK